jgi:hypothetical protein
MQVHLSGFSKALIIANRDRRYQGKKEKYHKISRFLKKPQNRELRLNNFLKNRLQFGSGDL